MSFPEEPRWGKALVRATRSNPLLSEATKRKILKTLCEKYNILDACKIARTICAMTFIGQVDPQDWTDSPQEIDVSLETFDRAGRHHHRSLHAWLRRWIFEDTRIVSWQRHYGVVHNETRDYVDDEDVDDDALWRMALLSINDEDSGYVLL